MSTERATRKFTTSGKHEVTIYTYLTGREFNEIQGVLIKDVKVSAIGQDAKIDGFNPAAVDEANKKLIELAVVSITGEGIDSSKSVADLVLDLPYQETQEVMDVLDELSGKKKASEG